MPLTPSNGDQHAQPTIDVYSQLDTTVWAFLAASLFPITGAVGQVWLMRKLLRLPRFRAQLAKLVGTAASRAQKTVEHAISQSWHVGAAAARADTGSRTIRVDDRAVQALAQQVLWRLDRAHQGIPGVAENIYRRTVQLVAQDQSVTDPRTQQAALQRALATAARTGLTAFASPKGQRRELVAYAEAQIRSAITAAEVDGYTQQLLGDGHDLIIVSDVPGSCPLCLPFTGQLLSISGRTVGAITASGQPVRVMCSLAEARERGLFHVNCRHTIGVWTPDDPAPPTALRKTPAQKASARRRYAQNRAARARSRVATVTHLSRR